MTGFDHRGANSVYCQAVQGHPYQHLYETKSFIEVSKASRKLLYYRIDASNIPGFDPKTFSECSPKTIYLNLY